MTTTTQSGSRYIIHDNNNSIRFKIHYSWQQQLNQVQDTLFMTTTQSGSRYIIHDNNNSIRFKIHYSWQQQLNQVQDALFINDNTQWRSSLYANTQLRTHGFRSSVRLTIEIGQQCAKTIDPMPQLRISSYWRINMYLPFVDHLLSDRKYKDYAYGRC